MPSLRTKTFNIPPKADLADFFIFLPDTGQEAKKAVAQFNIRSPRGFRRGVFLKNTFQLLEEEFIQRGDAATAFTPFDANVK